MSKTIEGYKEGHRGQPVISKDFDGARQRLLIAAEGQDGSRKPLADQRRTIVALRTIRDHRRISRAAEDHHPYISMTAEDDIYL